MIQRLLLAAAITFLLILSGCGKKRAPLATGYGTYKPGEYQGENTGYNNHNVSDATQISARTVTIDENTYGNDNTNHNEKNDNSKNQSDEKSANASEWNNSKDGFRSIYFAYDNYGLTSNMKERMRLNSELAGRLNGKIKIEGNCDEFGTDEYNFALGLKRAKAVKDNLLASGVLNSKVILVSLGESNPVCSNFTDNCYTKNRRVDLKIVR